MIFPETAHPSPSQTSMDALGAGELLWDELAMSDPHAGDVRKAHPRMN